MTVTSGRFVTKTLIEYSKPNEWLFFHGHLLPVPGWKFQEKNVGGAPIAWRFSPSTLTFYHSAGEVAEKRLNWLSAEIRFSSVSASLYSLDSFIEDVRYAGDEAPSPSVLVNAWSIVSGIVLSRSLGLTLTVILEDGTEASFPIDSTQSIGETVIVTVPAVAAVPALPAAVAAGVAIRSRIDLQRFFSDCSGINVMLPNDGIYRNIDSIGDSRIETTLTTSLAPPLGFNETEKSLDELAYNAPETFDLEKVD